MLSVLMATYHKEKPDFLRQCLKSLREQSRPANEIVLVKDGELCESLEWVVSEFADLPIKIVAYAGPDKLGGALREGLKHCVNPIVARMDSDDIATPNRFEKQLAYLESNNVDIVGSAIEEFECEPGDRGVVRQCPESVQKKHIVKRNPINHMTVMFRKDVIIRCGGYIPLEGFEDWFLWLRAFSDGAKIVNIDDRLVFARTDNNFLDRRSGWIYAKSELDAMQCFFGHGLISTWDYVINLLTRIPVRLLPRRFTKIIYENLLRRLRDSKE